MPDLTDEDRAAILKAAAFVRPETILDTFGPVYRAGLAAGRERAIEELQRGEFICKKCGLRKDGEHEPADF